MPTLKKNLLTINITKIINDQFADNLKLLLDLLKKNKLSATFFCTADVCQQYCKLLKFIIKADHDIASLCLLKPNFSDRSFINTAETTKHVLEKLLEINIHGYRLLGDFFPNNGDWAYQQLFKLGYQYNSSLYLDRAVKPYKVIQPTGDFMVYPLAKQFNFKKLNRNFYFYTKYKINKAIRNNHIPVIYHGNFNELFVNNQLESKFVKLTTDFSWAKII